MKGVDRLADHPQLGRPWPIAGAGDVRRLVVGRYLVYYELDPDQQLVAILTVRHGREAPVADDDILL